MRTSKLFTSLATATALCGALGAQPALGHGDAAEEAANFHEHLDDYRGELEQLAATVDGLVEAYADGEDVTGHLEGLTDEWEEVGVHAAIETQAMILYPGIWQGIGELKQGIEAGVPAADLRERADSLKAALWQGYGGLRLAANRLEQGDDDHAAGAADEPGEAIHAITDMLEHAVEAYEAGELERARDLIFDSYMQRFEYLEGDLIEQDPELVSSLEEDFNANLPLLMKNEASLEDVRAKVEAMIADLETAEGLLEAAQKSDSEVF